MDRSPLRSKRCRRRGTRSGRAQLRQEVGPQTISLQARLIRGLRRMEQIRAQVYLVCAEATVYRRPCLQLDAQGPHVHCLAMPLFGPRLLGKCRSHGIQRDDACHSRTRPPARPIRCDAIVRWAPLLCPPWGSRRSNEKPCLTRQAWISVCILLSAIMHNAASAAAARQPNWDVRMTLCCNVWAASSASRYFRPEPGPLDRPANRLLYALSRPLVRTASAGSAETAEPAPATW